MNLQDKIQNAKFYYSHEAAGTTGKFKCKNYSSITRHKIANETGVKTEEHTQAERTKEASDPWRDTLWPGLPERPNTIAVMGPEAPTPLQCLCSSNCSTDSM